MTPAFALSSQLSPISAIGGIEFDLSEPDPDPRLAPQKALAKAYQRAILRHGDELLAPGEPKGNLFLRQALAAFLKEQRGLKLEPEQLLITRGTTQGLQLLFAALFRRGGCLLVEEASAPFYAEALSGHPGINLVPVPIDGGGLRLDALEGAMNEHHPLGMLIQPVTQVPSGTTLAPSRRDSLLALAARQRMAILEEDSGFPYSASEKSPLPLAAEDRHGSVVYSLSLSRLLAPGLRLGLLAGPKALVDRLARLRREASQQGDRVLEWATGDLIRDGDFERALRRNARIYAERARQAEAAVESDFGMEIQVRGRSGMGLWLAGRPGFPMESWIRACLTQGVRLRPVGETGAWMGTASLDEARLPDLLARLKQARDRG